jgi:hypothetical protein
MMDHGIMPTPPSRQLQALRDRLQELAARLANTGFVSSGTLLSRYVTCGKPSCRCHADPPQLHGPYWDWSRSIGGHTVSRRLSEPQAHLYQEWIANRRAALEILAEMEEVSARAADLLLAQSPSTREEGDGLTTPRSSRTRA